MALRVGPRPQHSSFGSTTIMDRGVHERKLRQPASQPARMLATVTYVKRDHKKSVSRLYRHVGHMSFKGELNYKCFH